MQPPTIVLFTSDPQSLSQTYQRYLLSVFRDNLPFSEVPIKLYLRKRAQSDQTDEIDAKLGK
jgi:GTP-binding protein